MGIIDDYLTAPSEAPAAVKSSGLVEQYLTSSPAPKTLIPPKPPISGASPAQSEEINAQPSIIGGVNPRDQESYTGRAGGATYDAAKAGVLEAGSGLSDALSGKPASGLGKIGMGALGVITSPLAAGGQLAGDITGNKDFANKVELTGGAALPVKGFNKFSPVSIPTISTPNPLTKVAKKEALDELVSKITSNGREPQKLVETIQQMKSNPRIGPADTSPAVLNMTQKLFTTEGDAAKNYLHSTSTNRVKSSADTVSAAFDQAAGLPVNAVNKLKELKEAAQKVGTEQINPAVAGSKPVDLTPVINHIDEILKPGVMSKITGDSTLPFSETKAALATIKGVMANDAERLTDAKTLHSIQSKLRINAQDRINSSNGAERQLGHAMMAVRNKIVDAIDIASPRIKDAEGKEIGSYKPALSKFRDERQIDEAFHDAYNGVLINSKKLENRPEFTKEWFDGLTDLEKKAAVEGIRTRIDTEIGVAKNPALVGTSLGKSEFNQKKIEHIIGKEETDKLLKTLEHERSISNTHNKIIEGSQTEMRRAGDEAVGLSKDKAKPEPNAINKYALPIAAAVTEAATGQTGLATLGLGAIGVGAKVASKARAKVTDMMEKERNLELAKMALPENGPSRDQLIKDLEAHLPKPKLSILNRARLALPVANP